MLFQELYRKHFRQHFFTRVIAAYTSIILCTVFVVAAIISDGMDAQERNREELRNAQVVESTRTYFVQKDRTARQVLQQLYLNPRQHEGVFELLNTTSPLLETEYWDNRKLVDDYLKSVVSLDPDITEAMIYNKKADEIYLSSRDLLLDTEEFRANNLPLFDRMDDRFYGPHIVRSREMLYTGGVKRMAYTVAVNIRGSQDSLEYAQSVGILFLNFSTSRVAQAYENLFSGYVGQVLVTDGFGEVLFDSSGQYYGKPYPFFEQIRVSSPRVDLEVPSIANTSHYDKLNIYTVGLIPVHSLRNATRPLRRFIALLATVCVAVTVAAFLYVIRFFSRRISEINEAIRKSREGDLTQRIQIRNDKDEISLIASNFNDMCEKLEGYISRVYLAELKQKDAIIFALQSQINPHFLYNTLEVIRMAALEEDAFAASHMIEHLSKLFRSSINTNQYVKIEDELNVCKSYLEIYNLRTNGRVDLVVDAPKEIQPLFIVKHILQPIVENAIVHGFQMECKSCSIHIAVALTGADVMIRIQDNGIGMPPGRLNEIRDTLSYVQHDHPDRKVGLRNVEQRIKMLFGPSYGISLHADDGEGTTVTLVVPVLTSGGGAGVVQCVDCGR